MQKPLVLTIAGSDPSGGAGIQADIRAFESQGVYGFSVITALTVQTVEKVIRWVPVDPQLIHDQLTELLENYPIHYVKCGMLPTQACIEEIIAAKQKYNFQLVVDPIIISGSGMQLVEADAIDFFKTQFIPVIDILTPNAREAQYLTDLEISDFNSIQIICRKFIEMGTKAVILKGGHINPEKDEVIDYLFYDEGFELFPRERIFSQERVHGTGCIFSSIFLAQLALTDDIYTSMINTERQIDILFRDLLTFPSDENLQFPSGKVLDFGITQERNDALNQVMEVYEFIKRNPDFTQLIPEVRTNISIATQTPKSSSDIAAIDGRITIVNNIPFAAGPIKFGASNHTARLLLTANKIDPSIHAVMNIKYDPVFIEPLAEAGLFLFEIRREDQPEEVQNKEKSTMQWVVETGYSINHSIPDIIWDTGELGKEPMLRLFAKDGSDLINKLKVILRVIREISKKQ